MKDALDTALEGTPPPEFDWLRAADIGLAMVRGRVGGSGEDAFNLGEVTVTRATLRLRVHEGRAEVGIAVFTWDGTRSERRLPRSPTHCCRRLLSKPGCMSICSRRSLRALRKAGSIDLATLTPSFNDTVHDSQGVFRALLNAFSRPGKIVSIDAVLPGLDQDGSTRL